MVALAVLTMHKNEFDVNSFKELEKALQKNPYQSATTKDMSPGDVQSTREILRDNFGVGGKFAHVNLDSKTADVLAEMLCAEKYRKDITYLLGKWPDLYEVQNAKDGLPPPELDECEYDEDEDGDDNNNDDDGKGKPGKSGTSGTSGKAGSSSKTG